jgi:transposase-like protein
LERKYRSKIVAALTEEQRELILELAEDEYLTKAEIARRAGVSRPTVYKVFREAGLDEPVSEEEDNEETSAGDDEAPDAEGYEDEEDDEEDEHDAYGDEDADEEDDEAAEEEEPEELPAPIVLGSPASALVGLVGGAVLGAVGLYYAMTAGLIGPPGPGRADG